MKNTNPFFNAIHSVGLNIVGDLMIGMPGHVIAFDASTQRAQIECGIQRQMTDGSVQTLPLLVNVPVQFAGSSEWATFHELPAGTEGYIHFSQRSVDAWLDTGGPVAPVGPEMFSASDAFFSPGYRSMKTAIPGLPISGMGMSNRDGSIRLHLTDGGIVLTCGGQTLELTASGLTHNGINIGSDHIHGGVEKGGSNTNGPQ